MTQLPLGRRQVTEVQLNLGSAGASESQEARLMSTGKSLSLRGQVSEICSYTTNKKAPLASADPLVRRRGMHVY